MAERREARVTFLPSGATVTGREGDTLLDATLEHGLALEHECGGNCSCTTCRLEVVCGGEHLSAMEWPEDDRLRDLTDRTAHSRLACQALLTGAGDVVVRVTPPRRSPPD